MNGGPEKYQGGEECEVEAIVSVSTAEKNPTYLVRWAGYDSTYQTWETAEDIAPALLKAFHARIACPVRLEQPMHEMREAVAQVLMKMRRPMASVEVTVHIAALAPLAHALLACASRPPSTRGGPALEIERDVGPDVTTTSVQLDEPEDVGHMLQLQAVREGGYGCAILKKGRGGNSNITIIGSPFVLSYVEPTPRADGLYVPGAKFTVTGSVWIFNGTTGAPMPAPGLPNETMLKPLGEYLKGVLRGRKAWGFKHRLQTRWAELPRGHMELSIEDAMPRKCVKRARVGPQTGGVAAPAMLPLE